MPYSVTLEHFCRCLSLPLPSLSPHLHNLKPPAVFIDSATLAQTARPFSLKPALYCLSKPSLSQVAPDGPTYSVRYSSVLPSSLPNHLSCPRAHFPASTSFALSVCRCLQQHLATTSSLSESPSTTKCLLRHSTVSPVAFYGV